MYFPLCPILLHAKAIAQGLIANKIRKIFPAVSFQKEVINFIKVLDFFVGMIYNIH